MIRPELKFNANLLADLPAQLADEQLQDLLRTEHFRVERIVSTGQSSPPGFWYDQDRAEWVLVLAGAAQVLIEGESKPRSLSPGDHLLLRARQRHRVEWTDPTQPTVWLAIFFDDN